MLIYTLPDGRQLTQGQAFELGGNRTFGNPTVTGVIGVDRVLGVLVPEIS